MTRRHLLDAAGIVFARDGFHGATLDEVASTAGFTKGAVYSNFSSKDDLFLALLDERVDTEIALAMDVLESGSHEQDEQRPRVRDLLRAGVFFHDDSWNLLYLEFVLYARRNEAARERLVASARRSRALAQELIEREYEMIGGRAEYPPRELATISTSLFEGLQLSRVIDPESVTDETLDVTLAVLYDSMRIDAEPESDDGRP